LEKKKSKKREERGKDGGVGEGKGGKERSFDGLSWYLTLRVEEGRGGGVSCPDFQRTEAQKKKKRGGGGQILEFTLIFQHRGKEKKKKKRGGVKLSIIENQRCHRERGKGGKEGGEFFGFLYFFTVGEGGEKKWTLHPSKKKGRS